MMLLVIPGAIAMVMLWVAVPVAVTERCGPVKSLGRSRQLTKGNRWRIFGIILVVILIQFGLSIVNELILGAAAGGGSLVASAIGLLIGIFFALLFAVISAVGYHDLRAAKEGADIEQIAAVFGRGFSILFGNIVSFGLLALIVYAPYIVLSIVEARTEQTVEQAPELTLLVVVVALVAYLLLYFLLNAAVVFGTVQDLRGARVSLGACLRRGLATIFPVLGAGLLAGIVTVLGFVAFVIPGFIVMVMVWVAIPVAVIERRGPIECLSRSIDLTKGNRWRVFGIVLLIVIVNSIASGVVEGFAAAASGQKAMVVIAISTLVDIFFALLFAVLSAVEYHDLRAANEGTDSEQLAAVFD